MTVLVEEFKILISTFSHVSVVDDPLNESPELFIVQYDFGFIGFISDCIPIEVSVGPFIRVFKASQALDPSSVLELGHPTCRYHSM